ncbi:hypothetical protein BJX99DRAFT_169144 [Aspergillus californicus]
MGNNRHPNERIRGSVSAFSGGFSESIRRQLENVNLPEKVKCKVCKKFRSQVYFSKRQLDILRNELVTTGPRAATGGWATCCNCTGGQTQELKCRVCDEVKGLNAFAIGQRKEHEDARCLNCVQGHADAEPVLDENRILTEGEMSTTQGTITASHASGGTLTNASRMRTLTEAPGHSARNSVYDNDNEDDDASVGGGFVEPNRYDASSSRGNAFNSNDYSPRNQASLAAGDNTSVHSEWATFNIRSPNTAASVQSGAGRAFAKVKAFRAENPERPPVRIPDIPTLAHQSDDEEDEEGLASYL